MGATLTAPLTLRRHSREAFSATCFFIVERSLFNYQTQEFRMSLLPVYSLAVWTLAAPLLVAIVEWVITRRQRSELTTPRGTPGYAN